MKILNNLLWVIASWLFAVIGKVKAVASPTQPLTSEATDSSAYYTCDDETKPSSGLVEEDFKCPFTSPHLLFRNSVNKRVTFVACQQKCLDHSQCKYFSFGTDDVVKDKWRGICVGCTADAGGNFEATEGFDTFEICEDSSGAVASPTQPPVEPNSPVAPRLSLTEEATETDANQVLPTPTASPTKSPTVAPTVAPLTENSASFPPVPCISSTNEITFSGSELRQNNLDGQGPLTDTASDAIRYGNVGKIDGRSIDLVVTVKEHQTYTRISGNGYRCDDVDAKDTSCLTGNFGTINNKSGRDTTFVFRFVDGETDKDVTVPEFYFSIFDIDQSTRVREEYGITGFQSASYDSSNAEAIFQEGRESSSFCAEQPAANGNCLYASSKMIGKGCDNPVTPFQLGEFNCQDNQGNSRLRALLVLFEDTNKFEIRWKTPCIDNKCTANGRNFLFAFRSGLVDECPTAAPVDTDIPTKSPTLSPTKTTSGIITGSVKNSEEDGIKGVTIYLKDEDSNDVLITATDMNGSYSFKDLPPGDYTVSHDIPEGFITTEEGDDDPDGDEFDNDEVIDNNIGVRVYPGQTDSGNNFVDLELGAITGSVKDSTGSIVYGVLIRLKDENGDVILSTTVTNNDGIYSFTNLLPGDYTVVQENHDGYNDVSDQDEQADGDIVDSDKTVDNSIGVSLNAGERDTGNNFVDEKVGTISGSVTDSSGMQLHDIVIELFDNNKDVVLTTVTGEDGLYTFSNVPPKNYTIVQTNRAGYLDVKDQDVESDGDIFDFDESVDSTIGVTLLPGETDTGNNFVDVQTVSPTASPTKTPTASPTKTPTASPTKTPTASPTKSPTASPTKTPTASPTRIPVIISSLSPSFETGSLFAPVPCHSTGDEFSFVGSELLENNLDAQGPLFNTASSAIRYGNVGRVETRSIDLVVTLKDNQEYNRLSGNGYRCEGDAKDTSCTTGDFGTINNENSMDTTFVFKFVDGETDETVTVPEFYFSVFDIDSGISVREEYGITGFKSASYDRSNAEAIFHEGSEESSFCAGQSAANGNCLYAQSKSLGKGCDNPVTPFQLGEFDCQNNQGNSKLRSFIVFFEDTNEFEINWKTPCDTECKRGRNFLFAFRSGLVDECSTKGPADSPSISDTTSPTVPNSSSSAAPISASPVSTPKVPNSSSSAAPISASPVSSPTVPNSSSSAAPTSASPVSNSGPGTFEPGTPRAGCPVAPLCTNNLGSKLSGATGEGTIDPYPQINVATKPKAYDNSVAVLVQGDLVVSKGAEIEGKIVVLGDFIITGSSNFQSFGRAGAGSQVVPNNGEDVILVGGNLLLEKSGITFMSPGYGSIVVKGSNEGNLPQLYGGSEGTSDLREDADLDLSEWSDAFCDLEEKATFWGSLTPNGITSGIGSAQITFAAGDDDCVQIFHIKATDLTMTYGIWIKFDSSLVDKTILINVEADSTGTARVVNLADFVDTTGQRGFQFSSALVSQILWNFYDATEVILGCGTSANGEWAGSILVPKSSSSLQFCFPGHSGRTIVNGDLEQHGTGSEFHNYDFDPPCPLPTPISYNSCSSIDSAQIDDSSKASIVVLATEAPVVPATEAPVAPPTEAPVAPPSFVCEKPKGCRTTNCATQCPSDMPTGYYPDLKDCRSYCYCTGRKDQSRYETCQHGLYWDPLGWNAPRGTRGRRKSYKWLTGKWGANTYWGSNGGICNWKANVQDTRPNPPKGCSTGR